MSNDEIAHWSRVYAAMLAALHETGGPWFDNRRLAIEQADNAVKDLRRKVKEGIPNDERRN